MICKQCKRTVTTEDMALSGYTKQDGTKSRRNICKICHHFNRYTTNAIKMGATSVVNECLNGYKSLVDNIYNGVLSDNTLPVSITEAYRAKFKVPAPPTEEAGEVNPLHAFMNMITDGGFTIDMVKSNYDDLMLKYQVTLCSDDAALILKTFLRRMSETADDSSLEDTVEFLYSCSINTNVTDVVRDGNATYTFGKARTDILYPEVFLSYLFEAAESIYDEDSFNFFGYQIYPRNNKFWQSIYSKLNEICGVQAISY